MTHKILQGSLPLPERIGGAVRAAILRGGPLAQRLTVYGFDTLSSTMDAAAAFTAGELQPTELERYRVCGEGSEKVFLALSQTSGRGRKQRTWLSPEGRGLYVTYVFPTVRTSAALSGFSLVLGLAVQECTKAFGAVTFLKWPNDVLGKPSGSERQRKLAGILVEVGPSVVLPEGRAVLAGIGMNLGSQEFPHDVPATSLEELLGRPVAYEEAFFRLSAAVLAASDRFLGEGFPSFAAEWNERSGQCGETVTVEGPEGVSRTGTVLGVAADGALRLREDVSGNEAQIYSGELVASE